MKRWVAAALILTLLVTLFPMGSLAEGPVRKGKPVLTFVPANTIISAQAGGPSLADLLLGSFRVDGSSVLSDQDKDALSSGITSTSLVYQEGEENLIESVKLEGGRLYATLKSPVAPSGKAEIPIKFADDISISDYVTTSLPGQQIATVCVYTAVSTVSLDKTEYTFTGKSEPIILTATVNEGTPAADVEYQWYNSAPEVVRMEAVPGRPDQQAITPLAEGTAIIDVIAQNQKSRKSAKCQITVTKVDSRDVVISGYDNVTVGERVKLTATIYESNSTDTVKSWTSSNPEVATIDSNGVLTAISEGTTIITVTTAYGRNHAPTVLVKASTGVISKPAFELSGDLSKPGASVEITTTTVDAKIYYTMTDNGKEPAKLTAANAATVGTLYERPIPLPENKKYRINAIAVKGSAASEEAQEEYTVDIAVTSFTLDKTAVTVNGKSEVALTANVIPESANIKSIQWSCEPGAGVSMAEKSPDGKTYKLKTTGTSDVSVEATITYGAESKTKKANCKISVNQVPESSVSASPAALTIPAGRTAVLKAVVSPANASHEKVDFFFDKDSAVISVRGSEDGVVQDADSITIEALKTGEGKSETITLVTKNGLRTTCTVTVTAASSKVAAPVFNVPGGTVFIKPDEEDRTVELSSATTGAEFAYTINGVLKSGSLIVIPENTTAVVVAWATKPGLQKSDTVTATFSSATAVTGLELGDDIEINGRDTYTITAALTPNTAKNRALTWKSDDTSVATVAQMAGIGNELKAVITALKPGTAIITATTADGGFKDSVRVTVRDVAVESVKIFDGDDDVTDETLTINKGEVRQLTAVGFNGSDKVRSFVTPIWTSSDNSVAKVDPSGRVTIPANARSDKAATITAYLDGQSSTVTIQPGDKPTKVADLQFHVVEGSHRIVDGKYDSEITVKATTATEGAVIYYTLNGSEPSTSSARFPSAGIRLSKKTTLKAVAVKSPLEAARATETYDFNIEVQEVRLDATSLTVTKGKSAPLKATVIPSNATNANITWTVDRSGLVTIDKYGTLTANAVGEVTVTATAGSKTATCLIKIVDVPATAITLSPTASTMEVGEAKQLTAQLKPAGLAGKTISWTSSDEFVASVSDDGLVTALREGTATITATVDAVKATAKITVEAPPSVIPAEPRKEVTFAPEKSFTVTEGTSLSKVIGKLKPGEGETIDQIRYYCNIIFDVTTLPENATTPRFVVSRDGTVTLHIANVGDSSSSFSYEWKLTAKPISGFIPSDDLMNSGRVIVNELLVVKAPADKKIDVNAKTVPSMTTYKKKPVYILNRKDKKVTFSVPDYTVTAWKSSHPRLLAINSRGVATLKKSSNTIIKVSAKLKGGGTVSQYVAVKNIATIVKLQYKKGKKWVTFGDSPVSLTRGKKLAVRVVAPKGTKIFAAYKWQCDNPAVATYKSGYITGIGEGDVTFRYALDSGFVAAATINVVSAESMSSKSPSMPETSSVTPAAEPEETVKPDATPSPDITPEPDASNAPEATPVSDPTQEPDTTTAPDATAQADDADGSTDIQKAELVGEASSA